MLLLLSQFLSAQEKYGHQWILENYNYIDFNDKNPTFKQINVQTTPIPGSYNTAICDKKGNLQFHTSGCFILNSNHLLMTNGDNINSNLVYGSWCKNGLGDFPITQNVTILPSPKDSAKYFVFNLDFIDAFPLGSNKLAVPLHVYVHTVDMNKNNGLGEVIEKKVILIKDTMSRGYIQALRHDNKTDWWVIIPKWNSNCFYTTLLTSNGLDSPKLQCVGRSWGDNDIGGQVNISPDGKRYARIDSQDGLSVYDFDTKHGILSNPISLIFPRNSDFSRGICFSNNSKYLYVVLRTQIYQYDLTSMNIQSSMQLIGELDSFAFNNEKGFFARSKLGPDGKIYIFSPFSHKYLSIINRPDCPGKLCDFRPHALQLPAFNYAGLPNSPFFEIPPANYNCDSINTATEEIIENVAIYPNPATTQITIYSSHSFQQFDIIALTGQTMLKGKLVENKTDIDVSTLPEGIYFIKLTNPLTQTRALGKFVLKR